jgi:phosphate transport system substrate-binding protein
MRILAALLAILLGRLAPPVGAEVPIHLGAGATLPYPLYQEWIGACPKDLCRIISDPVGSGKGIRAFQDREVDFGATDSFLTDRELKKAKEAILHVPACIGVVSIAYNLPGNPGLRLSPGIVAAIFMGDIARWNDPLIREANPGIPLPNLEITVIHRADGSGTTNIFTGYLTKTDNAWARTIGAGRTVRWPEGLGLDGIGYVEPAHTRGRRVVTARVVNRAGNAVPPSPAAGRFADGLSLTDDLRATLTDPPGADAYPIVGFSYLIVYQEQAYGGRTRDRALALARFLWWAIHEGQTYNENLDYAALPEPVVAKAEVLVRSLPYDGQPLVDW